MTLEIDKYKPRTTRYNNAVVSKFDNRRCSVIYRTQTRLVLEFKRLAQADDDIEAIRSQSIELVKGKIIETRVGLTKETAEVIMLSLAELLGYQVMEK